MRRSWCKASCTLPAAPRWIALGAAALLLAAARASAQDASVQSADPDAGVLEQPPADQSDADQSDADQSDADQSDADQSDAIGLGSESAADSIGFGSTPAASIASTPAASTPPADDDDEPGALDAAGYLAHRLALWSERLSSEPLAQSRQTADLALRYKKPFHLGDSRLLLRLVGEGLVEYDFAYLHDPERFDQATIDTYRFHVIGRETLAALSWGPLELTFGRQIVPFGQGDILSPLDIVNPRDTREPGLAELEDIRMAVLASRAGLFVGPHRLEALVVHESFFGLRPAPLSDFSPLRKLLLDDPRASAALEGKDLRYDNVPDRWVSGASQVYGRYSYTGAGIDLALYAASTLDKQGIPQSPAREALVKPVIGLPLWHPRYTAFGHAGAKPLGDFVVRWELGIDLHRPLAVQEAPGQSLSLDMIRRHQINALLGVTYAGITDTRIWLEYAQRVVLDNPEREPHDQRTLFTPVEAPAFALRIRRAFLRERLVTTLVGTWVGIDPFVGAFARGEVVYELFDAFHAGLGYAAYFPSPHEFGPFYGFERNDWVYATVRWDFVLR